MGQVYYRLYLHLFYLLFRVRLFDWTKPVSKVRRKIGSSFFVCLFSLKNRRIFNNQVFQINTCLHPTSLGRKDRPADRIWIGGIQTSATETGKILQQRDRQLVEHKVVDQLNEIARWILERQQFWTWQVAETLRPLASIILPSRIWFAVGRPINLAVLGRVSLVW